MLMRDVPQSLLLTPMLKIVIKGETHSRSKYDELANCWLAALTRREEAVQMLASAQEVIENLENGFSKVIGRERVHQYRKAYCRGEDTNTTFGKFKADILQVADKRAAL